MKNNVLYFFLLVFLLTGCASGRDSVKPEYSASTETPGAQVLSLSFYLNQRFEIGEIIDVNIQNMSEEQIYFGDDRGVKLSILNPENNQWEEVANAMNYGDAIHSILEGNQKELFGVSILPVIPDSYINGSKNVQLRIEVSGIIMQDGDVTDEVATGSIEIELKP